MFREYKREREIEGLIIGKKNITNINTPLSCVKIIKKSLNAHLVKTNSAENLYVFPLKYNFN